MVAFHNSAISSTLMFDSTLDVQSHVSGLDLDTLRIKDSLARISDVLRLHALAGVWGREGGVRISL